MSPSLKRVLYLCGLLVVVGLIAAPFTLTPYWVTLIMTALGWAALAVAWNLVGGYTGQLSFAHPAFYGIGAYVSATLLSSAQWPWWLALPASGVGAAVASLLIYPCFRSQGSYFAIATLVLAESFRLLAQMFAPGQRNGMSVPPVWGINLSAPYFVDLVILGLTVLAIYLFTRGRTGLAARSIRANEQAAASLGINVVRHKQMAFIVSAFFVGLVGGAYAPYAGFVDPDTVFNLNYAVIPVMIAILGGIGTMSGPLLGTVAWVVITECSRRFSDSPALSVILYGAAILVVILFLPRGLAGIFSRLTHVSARAR